MSLNHQIIVQEQPKSPIAEAFRTLRTNLQFAKAGEQMKSLMFTSTGPGEGKSTIAANAAAAIAQSGKQVILMDCDLRKPVQHRIFGKKNCGLTNFLVEDSPIDFLIQPTDIDNLKIFTSGPIPPNPSELLGIDKMQQVIDELGKRSDCLIIDAPPVVAVTDACVLASRVAGVVLVLESGVVRPELAFKAKELIVKAKGCLVGVVLNRVEIEKEHAYCYYYYGNESKE